MSKYKALAEDYDLTNPRWVCGACGKEHPVDGPAYPICCGVRARFVTADDLPYVDSRESRLESARAQHREAYEAWCRRRDDLRYHVENHPEMCWSCFRQEGHSPWCQTKGEIPWWTLALPATQANWLAEEVDRLEAQDG